jgi:hypothetical protein
MVDRVCFLFHETGSGILSRRFFEDVARQF